MGAKEEMLRLGRASFLAGRQLGKSVMYVNGDMLLDGAQALDRRERVYTLGVKNTGQIRRDYLRRLVDSGDFLWHTLDGMAEGGRAVHVDLLNPLTGRLMTGSSGATAVNVLLGINDLGLGTDGGGSVLAPALSLNLVAVMAKGLGLTGVSQRTSTDGIGFIPGLGVISHSLSVARRAVETLLGEALPTPAAPARIAVCRPGCLRLPDGSDMGERLEPVARLLTAQGHDVTAVAVPDCRNRQVGIAELQELLEEFDLVITREGPVDVFGLGDSVLGQMGESAAEGQSQSGKYLVKIANMVNATAVVIPVADAAAGLVIVAREGKMAGGLALATAAELAAAFPLPELYGRYFRDGYRRRTDDLIFSLNE